MWNILYVMEGRAVKDMKRNILKKAAVVVKGAAVVGASARSMGFGHEPKVPSKYIRVKD